MKRNICRVCGSRGRQVKGGQFECRRCRRRWGRTNAFARGRQIAAPPYRLQHPRVTRRS